IPHRPVLPAQGLHHRVAAAAGSPRGHPPPDPPLPETARVRAEPARRAGRPGGPRADPASPLAGQHPGTRGAAQAGPAAVDGARAEVWQRLATKWAIRPKVRPHMALRGTSPALGEGPAEPIFLSSTPLPTGKGFAIRRQTRPRFAFAETRPEAETPQ